MEDIDNILEEGGLSKDSLEAALELARLVSQDTGLCCEGLGTLTWACYNRLEGYE